MKYRALFYSSAVALPLAAIALTGAHAATTTGDGNVFFNKKMEIPFLKQELTAEQQAAVEQAQALMKQAHEILEKAGLRGHHPGMMAKRIEFTDEQKSVLEQAKTLREQGKLDEAKALIEKAGLPAKPMFKMRFGRGMGQKPAQP
jgi:hypothetical protein